MPHHLKMMIIHQVNDIIFRTRKKIIQAYHVVTFVYKPSTEMRAYKTGSATYQYSFHSKYFYCLLKRRCLFVLFMVTNVTDLLKINNFRRGYFKKKADLNSFNFRNNLPLTNVYNRKVLFIRTIMMTNNPNANLIEAMKEKLPLKGQLADMLMDTLYIGKEAVYRRLRGEVPFTLQESALISRKLGISLDKIIGLSFKSNAMFNINIVDYDDPFESYYNILEKYVSLINTMPDDPNSVMGTSANIIPQTLYLKHELLAKFRLFKWMYQNKYIDCKSFEELDIPPKLVNIQKDYVAMTRHIHSIDYIWDNMIFQHLINDIQYFASIHLISDETKEEIKNELFLLADELEELAINGKTADGNRVRIYVSNINFEATYSYVDTNNLQMSLIRIYSINSITTMDNEIFCTLKEWIQPLKKFSTLISESGEMQRIQFFKQQREIIDAL